MFGIGDDLPNPDNRVSLSATERDEDGVPVAELHYRPGENDRLMMRYMLERLTDIAKATDSFEYKLQDYVDEGESTGRRHGICSALAAWAPTRKHPC